MVQVRLHKAGQNWFDIYLESVILLAIVGLFVLLSLLELCGFFRFPKLGTNLNSVLGTIVQSLASVFAIVFSVSLVAIQLCSEELSHRLIGLYVWNWNFVGPFSLNLLALLSNWFLLTNSDWRHLLDYGILWSFAAIFSLVPFFIYTIRFLIPTHVVELSLNRVKVNDILSKNFAEEELYQKTLQPIEDIVSNRVKKGDYVTARALLNRIGEKMDRVLLEVNERMTVETESSFIRRMMIYMSKPFAELFVAIAVSSNKTDAIEITIDVINRIAVFEQNFWQARFVPAFRIFDAAIERILLQARHRFSSAEYAPDLAGLEVAVARARAGFSKLVE